MSKQNTPNHICAAHEQNPKYHGLTLTCSACYQVWYLGCPSECSEVTQLLKVLGLNGINATLDTTRISAYNVLRDLFNSNSMFAFTCNTCKNKNYTFSGLKLKYDEMSADIKMLKSKNDKSEKYIDKLVKEKDQYLTEIEIKEAKIKEYDNEKNELMKNKEQESKLNDKKTESNETKNENNNVTYLDIKHMINDLSQSICSTLNDFMTKSNGEELRNNTKKRKLSYINDAPSSLTIPTITIDDSAPMYVEGNMQKSTNRLEFSGNDAFGNLRLKPPNTQKANVNGIFEIFAQLLCL